VSASKPAVPEPTRIGKYEIVAKLGAGAFGTVYKAMDPELGRLVAIKTIRLEGLAASQASLDDLLARFRREAQVAAKVKHPNIVTIYEFAGKAEGVSYISMEFVEGVGLDRVIAKSGRMSIERAAAIGAQVADALDYAWRMQKLVHRDIKPANIMIEPGDRVKVTDFGIAKATDSADHLTATGSLLGTPSYMSPEQARGSAVDGRSDLFSVGCILYEMLAGQKAFRGETLTAIMFKIITEEPPSLRTLDPTVTDEMLRIIAKALSKAPETRYQSGRELADDLLALTRPGFVPTLRASETPTLPPDTPPGDVPTIASPPTARAAATVSSAPTVVQPGAPSQAGGPPPLPPTVLTPATRREPPPVAAKAASPRTPAPPVAGPARRKGGGAGLIVGLGVAGVLALAVIAGTAWYLFGRKTAAPSPAPETAQAVETPAPAQATPPAEATPVEAAATPPTGAAVSTATPAPGSTSVAPPSAAGSRSGSRAAAGTTPPVAPRPPSTPPPGSGAAAAPPGDYAYLDDVPAETTDGRAAGEALAKKYGSGGSPGYTTGQFARRPRVPRGANTAERPAIATLLYLHSVQEAYHRKSGRYGNFRELSGAGLLALDVSFDADGFRRARYAFTVSAEKDAYRVEAMPQGPIGRALLVDDTGFVRWRDE
jgi:serine/threonine protein kinase